MSSRRIEIFNKSQIFLKISLKCHAFQKKKALRQLPNCHNGQSTPENIKETEKNNQQDSKGFT
jgi:hypothetical protein